MTVFFFLKKKLTKYSQSASSNYLLQVHVHYRRVAPSIQDNSLAYFEIWCPSFR